MADVNYIGGDNSLGADNNYETTQSAAPKVARCLLAVYREIDGTPFGNKGWEYIKRKGDTLESREKFRRFCLEAIEPLVRLGLIADPEVTIGDAIMTGGRQVFVSFLDVASNTRPTVAFTAWGK